MSLDYQLHASGEYAKRNNLHIVHTFSSTESGYKEGRVNFNKMLDAALMYNVRDIIFKNTDRLRRNDIDWPRCKRMAKTEGFHIHLYELNTVFNFDFTAEEEMFLDNTSSMASHVEIHADRAQIVWDKPYSFILNRDVMQYADTPVAVRTFPVMGG